MSARRVVLAEGAGFPWAAGSCCCRLMLLPARRLASPCRSGTPLSRRLWEEASSSSFSSSSSSAGAVRTQPPPRPLHRAPLSLACNRISLRTTVRLLTCCSPGACVPLCRHPRRRQSRGPDGVARRHRADPGQQCQGGGFLGVKAAALAAWSCLAAVLCRRHPHALAGATGPVGEGLTLRAPLPLPSCPRPGEGVPGLSLIVLLRDTPAVLRFAAVCRRQLGSAATGTGCWATRSSSGSGRGVAVPPGHG